MTPLPNTPTTQSGAFTFYATREYFTQLIDDITATLPGDRVLLATMNFEPAQPLVERLLHELARAAGRGVNVTVQVDAYNFLSADHRTPGPLMWRTTMPQRTHGPFAHIQQALQALEAARITTVITNIPERRFTSPFSGRSHIKCSIINDKIYLGGCNIDGQNLDSMVAWEDPDTADWLYDLVQKRVPEPRTLYAFGRHDIHHRIDNHSAIIVDVGVRHQSAIYEQALDIIDAAKEWLVITCQFFPNSQTAKHLKRAQQRGVKVFPIFNHYSAHSALNQPLQHTVTARERLHMPRSFFETELPPGTTYLHAKIVASESGAMIGSHNYVPAGVNFGTAEIALHNTTAHFSKAAVELITKETGLYDRSAFGFLSNKQI